MIAGLLDEAVHIGDCFLVGTAQLVVKQPRLPCYKLGLRFGRDDILKRFLQSKLTGFYFAVLEEGEVAAGDPIRLLHRDEDQVKVADITRLYHEDKHNVKLLQRVIEVEVLSEGVIATTRVRHYNDDGGTTRSVARTDHSSGVPLWLPGPTVHRDNCGAYAEPL